MSLDHRFGLAMLGKATHGHGIAWHGWYDRPGSVGWLFVATQHVGQTHRERPASYIFAWMMIPLKKSIAKKSSCCMRCETATLTAWIMLSETMYALAEAAGLKLISKDGITQDWVQVGKPNLKARSRI